VIGVGETLDIRDNNRNIFTLGEQVDHVENNTDSFFGGRNVSGVVNNRVVMAFGDNNFTENSTESVLFGSRNNWVNESNKFIVGNDSKKWFQVDMTNGETLFAGSAGTAGQVLRSQWAGSNPTWTSLDTSMIPENGNLYYSDMRVRGVPLIGFVPLAPSPIVAWDSIFTAFQKLQGTNTAQDTNISTLSGTLATKIGLNSLSALGPVTYNNTTGVFGISTANSTTTGALSAIDWNTFNNKQSAMVQATTSASGWLSSIDWNTFNNKQSTISLASPVNGLTFASNILGLGLASTTTTGALSMSDYNTFKNNWSLTGNTGLSAVTNFMGTTDAVDIAFRTNNVEKMRLFSLTNPSLGIWRSTLTGVNGGASSYSGPSVFMGSAANISGNTGWDFIFDDDNNASNNQIRFRANGDGAAGTVDIMTIDESAGGWVGIGNSSPNNKLEITSAGAWLSGLRFTNMLSTSATGAYNGKQLSVNGSGDVIMTDDATSANKAWGTTGNTGLSALTNFIGTTDAVDLVLKWNNIEGMRLLAGSSFVWQWQLTLNSINSGDMVIGGDVFFKNPWIGNSPGAFQWMLTNDNAAMYVQENASDRSDYTFKMGDNSEGDWDRYVFWETSYLWATQDKWPLVMQGNTTDFYPRFVGNNHITGWLVANSSVLHINQNTRNVGIGTTTPSDRLQVAGGVTATAYTTASDSRFKQGVTDVGSDALTRLASVRPVTYTWNALGQANGGRANDIQYGMIAQEVESLFPDLVETRQDGYKGINYQGFVPVLIKAVTSLDANKASTGSLNSLSGSLASQSLALSQMQSLVSSLSGSISTLAANSGTVVPVTNTTTVVNNYTSSGLTLQMTGTGSPATQALTAIQSDAPRSALAYITDQIAHFFDIVSDFVALQITAVRGYFDEVFAKKIVTETSISETLCVGTESNKTCITKAQLDALIAGAASTPAPVAPTVPVATISPVAPTPVTPTPIATVSTGSTASGSTPPTLVVPPAPILGCMDSTATNYAVAATQDDGSCIVPVVVPPVITDPSVTPSAPTTGSGV
jgi:hypothetical protein